MAIYICIDNTSAIEALWFNKFNPEPLFRTFCNRTPKEPSMGDNGNPCPCGTDLISSHHLFIYCTLLAVERAAMTSLTGEEIETNLYQSIMGPKTIGKVVAFLKATGLGYRKILEEIEISETQLAETEERIGLAVFDTEMFE
jgi:hypothetical protein